MIEGSKVAAMDFFIEINVLCEISKLEKSVEPVNLQSFGFAFLVLTIVKKNFRCLAQVGVTTLYLNEYFVRDIEGLMSDKFPTQFIFGHNFRQHTTFFIVLDQNCCSLQSSGSPGATPTANLLTV